MTVGKLKRDPMSWLKSTAAAPTTSAQHRRQDLNNLSGLGNVSSVIRNLEEQRRKKAEMDVGMFRSGKAWQRKYGNAADNLDFNKAATLACAILRDYETSPASLIDDMAHRFQSCLEVIKESSARTEDVNAFLKQLAAAAATLSPPLLATLTGTSTVKTSGGEVKPKFVLPKAVKFDTLEDAAVFEGKLRDRVVAPMKAAQVVMKSLFVKRCVKLCTAPLLVLIPATPILWLAGLVRVCWLLAKRPLTLQLS